LSAVDAHVGKHIFTQCIQGSLVNKTRILVTHQLHYLQHADLIICMEGGCIVNQGTYDELMQADNQFASLIQSFSGNGSQTPPNEAIETCVEKDHSIDRVQDTEKHVPQLTSNTPTKLMIDEDREIGHVAFPVYRAYIRGAGGIGFFLFLIFVLAMVEVARVGWVNYFVSSYLSLTNVDMDSH